MKGKYKNRQSIRLRHYDYSQQGLYFVTISTNKMPCLFGTIADDEMHMNAAGQMIETQWLQLTQRFNNIILHDYVVMPNHFHGIVEIFNPNKSLGGIVGAFKSLTTNAYIKGVKDKNWQSFDYKLWYRNYYEHVIRNEMSLEKITNYIQYNPAKWCDDKFFKSGQP